MKQTTRHPLVILLFLLIFAVLTSGLQAQTTVVGFASELPHHGEGFYYTDGNHVVALVGSNLIVLNKDLQELARVSEDKLGGGRLVVKQAFGTSVAITRIYSDRVTVATTCQQHPPSLSLSPCYAYSVSIPSGQVEPIVSVGEELKFTFGDGIVTSVETPVFSNGKYYAALEIRKKGEVPIWPGVYEIDPKSPLKARLLVSYGSLRTGTAKDGLVYYRLPNNSSTKKSGVATVNPKTLKTETVYETTKLVCFPEVGWGAKIVATCGGQTFDMAVELGSVNKTILVSAEKYPSSYYPGYWGPIPVFSYWNTQVSGHPFPKISGVAAYDSLNGDSFTVLREGDIVLGKPMTELALQHLSMNDGSIVVVSKDRTVRIRTIVFSGTELKDGEVVLSGFFPNATRQNVKVFENEHEIYPRFSDLFTIGQNKISFSLPATVGGGLTEFRVEIQDSSPPYEWRRSANTAKLNLPLNLPTVSIPASPNLLTPGESVEISWQASLPGRVTDIKPKPQGTLVLLPFNATSGKFSFKPSQAGIHTLEFTLANGSKIAKEFEVKFTLPQIVSVQNAAKDTAGLCPGAHATAFGSFAPEDAIWAEHKPVPGTFKSPKQMNFIIPSDFGPGLIKVQAVRSGQIAAEVEVQLLPTCPAAFEYNGNAILTDENFVLAVDDTNAPVPGKVYTLWSNGCGPTDPYVPTGEPAPSAPLSQATMPVSLNIGGNEAQVLFAGLAPGLLQVCQINFVMPGMPHGSNPQPVALRIKVGEQESTSSTLTY